MSGVNSGDVFRIGEADTKYIQFPDETVWRLSCSQLGKMLFDVEEGMEDGYDSVKFRVIYQEDNKPNIGTLFKT